MKSFPKEFSNHVVLVLRGGAFGVMPTDTLYGVVGSAFSEKAVSGIYRLKGRNRKKPFIIVVSSPRDLGKFNVHLTAADRRILRKIWPGPVSVVLPVGGKKFGYLKRGGASLAFRCPRPEWLRKFLKKSGPLVAPSANPENGKPAKNIQEAKKYFGDRVGFYVDGGTLRSKSSTVIKLEEGKIEILRQGAYKFS